MRRESTSRPRLSVPSACGSAPAKCQSGGAVAATDPGRADRAGPGAARRSPRGAAARASRRRARPASARAAWRSVPRVSHAAASDSAPHTRDRRARLTAMNITANGQDEALDQRKIAVDDRVDREIADAGIGEDALDQHRAAEQKGELHAGQRSPSESPRCATLRAAGSRATRKAPGARRSARNPGPSPRQRDFNTRAIIAASGSASASAGIEHVRQHVGGDVASAVGQTLDR